ncbi:hypothetical protein NPIL_26431 [Nephila pilipes]|uniref:Uncharacterized protein n=1 Tax=Nephila pilipes TaxID=299642 RepID=A0A8X6NA31_NEPPI|nr:hypothetical protein NPIL_26431 [Nephila pilipes]
MKRCSVSHSLHLSRCRGQLCTGTLKLESLCKAQNNYVKYILNDIPSRRYPSTITLMAQGTRHDDVYSTKLNLHHRRERSLDISSR